MKRLSYLLVPLFLSACHPDPFGLDPEVNIDPEEKVETANMIFTGEQAPGEITNLTIDDVFKVELDANPSTGIWWSEPDFDETVLTLVSNEYIADPAPEGLVGSGGTRVMNFKAVGIGATNITSTYSRGGGEVFETLDMVVEVTE